MVMAGEIGAIGGGFADALPSPVAASPNRSTHQGQVAVPEARGAPGNPAPQAGNVLNDHKPGYPEDNTLLASILGRVQAAVQADNTAFYYERDGEDGKMYLHVKNKRTGEEIYRIPRNYLKNMEPSLLHRHQVDVRI
jgi:hypothetical protein